MKLECKLCGAEFTDAHGYKMYCPDCCQLHSLQPTKQEKKNDPNKRLIDEVKEATRRGLSYGNYMGRKNTNG